MNCEITQRFKEKTKKLGSRTVTISPRILYSKDFLLTFQLVMCGESWEIVSLGFSHYLGYFYSRGKSRPICNSDLSIIDVIPFASHPSTSRSIENKICWNVIFCFWYFLRGKLFFFPRLSVVRCLKCWFILSYRMFKIKIEINPEN